MTLDAERRDAVIRLLALPDEDGLVRAHRRRFAGKPTRFTDYQNLATTFAHRDRVERDNERGGV